MNPQKSEAIHAVIQSVIAHNLGLFLTNWTLKMSAITFWHSRRRECDYRTWTFWFWKTYDIAAFRSGTRGSSEAQQEAWISAHKSNHWLFLKKIEGFTNDDPSVYNPRETRASWRDRHFQKWSFNFTKMQKNKIKIRLVAVWSVERVRWKRFGDMLHKA